MIIAKWWADYVAGRLKTPQAIYRAARGIAGQQRNETEGNDDTGAARRLNDAIVGPNSFIELHRCSGLTSHFNKSCLI